MSGRKRVSRWVLVCSITALAVGFGAAVAQPSSANVVGAQPVTTAIEVPDSLHPTVSGDGRYIVYQGAPATDDRREHTVYLRDRDGFGDVELTRLLPALEAGDSVRPVISADGCSVVVITEIAYDLFRDDDLGDRWDVYRLVLPHCGGSPDGWELVSSLASSQGGQSAADDVSPDSTPAISGAGTVVAYAHRFSVTAADVTAIALVDLTVPLGEPGRVRPVAGTPSGDPDSLFNVRGLRDPAISDDGDVVAFTSDATSAAPVAEWGTGPDEGGWATSHVYVWDRTVLDLTTAVRAVSFVGDVDTASEAGISGATPAVSADGRFVAFVSTAPDLVDGARLPDCAATCLPQVYRYDRADDTVDLVSRRSVDPDNPDAPPIAADAGAEQPTMSADGREIAFITRAGNLFPTRAPGRGGPNDGEVVVADVPAGTTSRLSRRFDGTAAPASQSSPKLSANGRVVVFDTLAGADFGVAATGRQVVAVDRTPNLTMDALDVGTVAVGFLGPEWFTTVVNRGPSAFTPALIESSSPDFLVSPGGTCLPEVPVAPGSSCTVFVTLLPTRPGRIEGTLTVSETGYRAATVTAALNGFGGDPSLRVDLAGAELGVDIVVGGLGDLQTFTLTNIGFVPTTVGSVTLTGESPEDFFIPGTTCSGRTLAIGAACTIDVVFVPKNSGERRAVVTATTGGGNYVTMQVNGSARFNPSMAVPQPIVRQGQDLAIAGSGFGPNSSVTLLFADGRGSRLTVSTNADGDFLALFPVQPIERPGQRELVALAVTGESVSTPVTIRPLPEQPSAAGPAFGN